MLPGGVERGEDLETALARELCEEIAATADVLSLLHILEHDGKRQYFYLYRARAWSAEPGDRTGPSFTDPARDEHHFQPIPLTPQALAGINLKPDTLGPAPHRPPARGR